MRLPWEKSSPRTLPDGPLDELARQSAENTESAIREHEELRRELADSVLRRRLRLMDRRAVERRESR